MQALAQRQTQLSESQSDSPSFAAKGASKGLPPRLMLVGPPTVPSESRRPPALDERETRR